MMFSLVRYVAYRRWRCAYRDPEVALRLPPANGLDPSGIDQKTQGQSPRFSIVEWLAR
jgi:hypothetical protein